MRLLPVIIFCAVSAQADTYTMAVRFENTNGEGSTVVMPEGMRLHIPGGTVDSNGVPIVGTITNVGAPGQIIYKTSATTSKWDDPPVASSLPAGVIVMWSGLLANVPAGWVLCDGQNGTPDLRDKFVKGWSAGVDPGGIGGSATYTPAGTVSTPTFTGDALSTHSHGVGSYVNSVPTFTGSALSTHTHTYTEVPNHVHLLTAFPTATGGSSGFTVDTSMSGTPANNSLNTANPTGGVATGTTAGTSAGTPAGTVSAPTISGSSAAVTAGTPSGTVSAPTFTGTQATVEPAYYKVAFIIKT